MTLKLVLLASIALATVSSAQVPQTAPAGGDVPAKFVPATANRDYVKREVMIPMRDGTKLYTVIVYSKGLTNAPIVLTRTPYDAKSRATRMDSPSILSTLPLADEMFVKGGYIRVYQDVRGKYGSEGEYVVTRPVIGPLNPTKVDHVTDAYDTIDWLVNKANLPESNGRVGMIGSSYEGFTVVMALLNPHPALKAAVPESPMIDGWMGDDWFHYGAFRQVNLDYFTQQTSVKGKGDPVQRKGKGADDYQEFLDAGSAGAYAQARGLDQLPWWRRLSAHPAYDALWQGQALDRQLVDRPSTVPTMWLQGLWDQEDIYGAVHAWEALTAKGFGATNHLAMGPWYHSQIGGRGDALGPLKWSGDTTAYFRREVLLPFFDTYLRDRTPARPIAPVTIYNPAEDHWDRFATWPGVKADALTPLYLQSGGGLSRDLRVGGADRYISDPAKPVPFEPLPVRMGDHPTWSTWLVRDQRFVSTRPDVLSYQTPVLDQAVHVEGAPFADIFMKTTGTDADVIVKIIDVYPDGNADDPDFAGYQLPVSLDIFRGRYRQSFEHPSAVPAGAVQEYRFRLPTMNYTFKPGHRIMVQIQSTLFPLYDRNPQTYMPNIFFAKPADYRSATVSIMHDRNAASAVLLPIVPASTAIDR